VRIGHAGDDMIAILHGDRERLENKPKRKKNKKDIHRERANP
jgi:hypothetical protein